MTVPRKTIAACVDCLEGAFTVEQLTSTLRDADASVSATATVYRAVAAMETSGYIERVGERDGSALFARCRHEDHHHHIICDLCGRTASARCPLDAAFLKSIRQEGFTVTRHEVTIYGRCSSCASSPRGAA